MMKKTMIVFSVAAFFALTGADAGAAIVQWDFSSLVNGGLDINALAATTADNVNAASLWRGNGVNQASPMHTADGTYSGDIDASVGSLADAVAKEAYFHFTLTAADGYAMSITDISAGLSRSTHGAKFAQWQYDAGDGWITIGAAPFTVATGFNQLFDVDLNDYDLNDIASISFRLVIWGSDDDNGHFYFEGRGAHPLQVNGAVYQSIPEPSSSLMLAMGVALVFVRRRKK